MHVGRSNMMFYGMLLMGISFICFGLLTYVQSKEWFIIGMLITRSVQGFSSCLIHTTMYSISANSFPDQKEIVIGYVTSVCGLGLFIGPILGSALFSFGGYMFIFYAIGSVFIITSTFTSYLFNDEVNDSQEQVELSLSFIED